MSDQQTALVTGGTGFIGSNLIGRLLSTGWTVHAIVRPHSDLRAIAAHVDNVILHVHDGSTTNMVKIVATSKPNVVFHLASSFLSSHSSSHSPEDITPLIQSTILFSTQLVEAMRECGVKSLVNTGTFWQHYENKDYSPVNLYAATKQAFEAILQYYVEAESIKVITLKLFDTYGPNDPRHKLFHLLGKAARTLEPLKMSFGEQLIDLVYIDNVIDAYLLAAKYVQSDTGHRIFAVTSGEPIQLRKIVQIYSEITRKPVRVEWGARPYRDREVMSPWRGEPLPGWMPSVGLGEGVSKMIDGGEK